MPRKVLAIGAHPDDVEFSCAGTLLKHLDQGDEVTILHMTNTGYKNRITGETLRTPEQSQNEAQKAAEIIGCDFVLLEFKEQEVPFNIDSITKVEEILIRLEIDTIYTHSSLDCHQDHIATYQTVLAASRNTHNIFLYEQLPLPRVRKNDSPDYFVDITGFFDKKFDILKVIL
mgnify:CR=1 FL=1